MKNIAYEKTPWELYYILLVKKRKVYFIRHYRHECVCYAKLLQSCLTFCDPMDYSPPGSSIHGIFQAGNLKWVAISFSRASSWPRDWTYSPCMVRNILYQWARGKPCIILGWTKGSHIYMKISIISFGKTEWTFLVNPMYSELIFDVPDSNYLRFYTFFYLFHFISSVPYSYFLHTADIQYMFWIKNESTFKYIYKVLPLPV